LTTQDERPQQKKARSRYFSRRKACQFCVDKVDYVDYKDTDKLKKFLSDRFMIESRRKTGVCAKHQRFLARAVKRARQLALIPFTSAHKGSFAINYKPRS
jgi:small subunit ribosomal protein S18|tara:strand:- start:465 stop:764 length:300 start_codon:yes stop_codon:yes gene_type:complete